jgi:hypothetical protein
MTEPPIVPAQAVPGQTLPGQAVPAPAGPDAAADVPWAQQAAKAQPRATSRARRTVRDLPAWDPLPPGEILVNRHRRD